MISVSSWKARFSTLVRVSPERVYDALATPEGLDSWFTTGAAVDARAGGSISLRWEHWGLEDYSGENGGAVLEAKRPQRFVFRWLADSGGYETTVEIDIEPHRDGSVIRLVGNGYEDSEVGMQDLMNRQSGWAQALTLMKFSLEHGVGY